MSFAHLHVRSSYSFLRGTIQIRDLVKRVSELNMPWVALTDLGQMFGIWKFYREALRAGVRPILGLEAFVAPQGMRSHPPGEAPGTLVLLARDLPGYRNLTRLTARANMEGFFHQPRVDAALLAELSEGLIALSSGPAGEIPRLLENDLWEEAHQRAKAYAKIFPGRLYLELQGNGLPSQAKVNDGLRALGRTLGLPLVAASEARYLNKEGHGAYEVLQCIRTRMTLGFEGAELSAPQGEFYLKGPTEMRLEFSSDPEALSNATEIASSCQVDFPERRQFAVPRPDIGPPGLHQEDFQERADDHFLRLSREGLERMLEGAPGQWPDGGMAPTAAPAGGPVDPSLHELYRARLRKEASDIIASGSSAYFLVVADYVAHARGMGILVGPGRGPVASSLAARCLGITEIDPLAHGLSFELFLNNEARDYPEIGVEVPLEAAEELIDYIADTYGGSHFVAHSLRLTTLKGRTLLREVGRVFGVPLPLLDELCGMHPTHSRISLRMAVDEISLIKTFAESIPVIRKIIDFALSLEDLPRTAASSPYSLVASPRLLRDSVPLFLDYDPSAKRRYRSTVQYGPDAVEENGLLRFELFPRKVLSLLAATLRLASKSSEPVDLSGISLDDPLTLGLLASGNFSGIPYLENPWVGNLLRPFREVTFPDLVILCALHPPLSRASGLLEEYLQIRQGLREPPGLHPRLDHLLKESCGLILFREQLVALVGEAARVRPPTAEIMARILASGDPADLDAFRPTFLAKALSNGFPAQEANNLWLRLASAAPVAALKAHAVSLALITWRLSYLKARFPGEFMDAFMLSAEVDRERQESALKEWRSTHLRLVPPKA
jgi:DNA polymerase-3 subunit alpha